MALPALERLEQIGWQPILVGKGWAPALLAGHHWTVHRHPSGLYNRIRSLRTIARDVGIGRPSSSHGASVRGSTAGSGIDCVLLTNSFSSALEARLAGLHPLGRATDGRRLLLTHSLGAPATPHEADRFLALAFALSSPLAASDSPAPMPRLQATEAAQRAAARRLAQASIREPYACIVPFATGKLGGHSKAWPGFEALTRHWSTRHPDLPLIVLPGPGEEAQARSRFPGATALPGVGLDEYVAILARARLVIANDTGPGHMAAAAGCATISVLGPTDAQRYAVRGPRVRIVQAQPWPEVKAVERAVNEMLVDPPA